MNTTTIAVIATVVVAVAVIVTIIYLVKRWSATAECMAETPIIDKPVVVAVDDKNTKVLSEKEVKKTTEKMENAVAKLGVDLKTNTVAVAKKRGRKPMEKTQPAKKPVVKKPVVKKVSAKPAVKVQKTGKNNKKVK